MTKPAATPEFSDIAAMNFEQAIKELENIVKRLEGGQADLESSIRDYARGAALKAHCQKKLEEATLKVEKIVKTADGGLMTEPLDLP